MRTYVRGLRRHRAARGPGRVLRLGRAARRSPSARTAGDRRRRRRPRGQLRGKGVRGSHCDERRAGPPPLPPGDRRPTAHVCIRRGQQGGLPRVRGHDAAGRGAVDRRGVPRGPRARAALGQARGDRSAVAARRPRARRPAYHRRGRQDEVPRQGGERGGQARRVARRPARRRARLPPPAPGRAALGRRAGHRRKTPPAGHRERWTGRAVSRGRADRHSRARGRAASARSRPQPRPPTRPGAAPSPLDRIAARARPLARPHPRPSMPSSSGSSTA